MIVDGKKIAEEIYSEIQTRVERLGRAPVLAIIVCAPNFETQKYLDLKMKKAKENGIEARIIERTGEHSTEDFVTIINEVSKNSDGVIVQLPLPPSVSRDVILEAIPITHDVDGLRTRTHFLSPVVGAIRYILHMEGVVPKDKLVTIIGSGKLVGLPAYTWFVQEGAHVSIVTRDVVDISYHTKGADIIVCGAGSPRILKPDMVKEGVMIFDAGTSEEGGVLLGDADPACAEKSKLFTPVPGGIGPITVAVLLKNVVESAGGKQTVV